MEKSTPKKDKLFIQSGTHIIGKWNKQTYRVIRKVGAGMIGTVYLCRKGNRLVALKISEQAMSLTSEVNVLKSLNKVQDKRLGPFLIDVDDWETDSGSNYPFYVMEYIKGISMESFIKQNGTEWIGVFLIQMLEQLEKLHQAGWVFGDLKNDNLLITASPTTVQFIDVGGTTKIGRSVKEYSEFYDRAYWHLGTREAEPSYDLFAVVMVILTIYYPKQFKRSPHSKQKVFNKIANIKELQLFERSLQKAISGKYTMASEMKDELLHVILRHRINYNNKKMPKGHYLSQAFIILCLSGFYYLISLLII